MEPEAILKDVVDGFGNRKFAAGLCVAYIDFLFALGVPDMEDIHSAKDFYTAFPRREWRSKGKQANTLIVELEDGKTLSLRKPYNEVEAFFRARNNRFDYPSCPGHATQAWRDYSMWLDAMCGMHSDALRELRASVVDFVLTKLPSQEFDPSTLVKEPPLFRMLLEGFDVTKHKGELTGAAYQGIVFGFLRADNPHLQVEIDKVRTGSKRLQRVGDIDAWEGYRLAITAEVKQYVVGEDGVEQLAAFANAANSRGAIGIVCALGYDGDAKDSIEALGVTALDIEDMQYIVSLWDPMKQRTAISSLIYYVKHVEKSSALADRLDAFLKEASASFGVESVSDDAD